MHNKARPKVCGKIGIYKRKDYNCICNWKERMNIVIAYGRNEND